MKENSIKNERSSIEEDMKILEEFKTHGYAMLLIKYEDRNKTNLKIEQAIEHILSDYKKLQEEFKQVDHECERLEEKEVRLIKENEQLKEYIAIAPNLDEMTAIKYRNIRQDAYIQGRAEEQQKARQIINENYIPVQKIKDKIEDLKMSGGSNGKDNTENTVRELVIEVLQDILDESSENKNE